MNRKHIGSLKHLKEQARKAAAAERGETRLGVAAELIDEDEAAAVELLEEQWEQDLLLEDALDELDREARGLLAPDGTVLSPEDREMVDEEVDWGEDDWVWDAWDPPEDDLAEEDHSLDHSEADMDEEMSGDSLPNTVEECDELIADSEDCLTSSDISLSERQYYLDRIRRFRIRRWELMGDDESLPDDVAECRGLIEDTKLVFGEPWDEYEEYQLQTRLRRLEARIEVLEGSCYD